MSHLVEDLQEQAARTIVYPMHEPWLDVGHPSDLERARDHQSSRSGHDLNETPPQP